MRNTQSVKNKQENTKNNERLTVSKVCFKLTLNQKKGEHV